MSARLLKVIACEIAFREICHVAARSPSVVELQFLSQGLHDVPKVGLVELQRAIDAVPAGRYDAILVGAASPDVPQPLVDQLAVGGQLLVPVGGRDEQVLLRVRRTETGMTRTRLDAMRFVPLIGAHGFSS